MKTSKNNEDKNQSYVVQFDNLVDSLKEIECKGELFCSKYYDSIKNNTINKGFTQQWNENTHNGYVNFLSKSSHIKQLPFIPIFPKHILLNFDRTNVFYDSAQSVSLTQLLGHEFNPKNKKCVIIEYGIDANPIQFFTILYIIDNDTYIQYQHRTIDNTWTKKNININPYEYLKNICQDSLTFNANSVITNCYQVSFINNNDIKCYPLYLTADNHNLIKPLL